jgi:L-aspartate oxidase
VSQKVIVIGAGIAGLMTALHLAPREVVVLSRTRLGSEGSTLWAQGGLAACIGADDSPELHEIDTLAAGDGLCDPAIVARFTREAPQAIAALSRFGVNFDRDARGNLALGLEAAHSRRRITHAGGDGTGRELMRALSAAALETPSIRVMDGVAALRLMVADGHVHGVLAQGTQGRIVLPACAVVIATGGIGGLYDLSTNPRGSFGQGLALAARAGAAMADMEFVQFHPTALDCDLRPTPLISEAVRGEGAILIDDAGERFMADVPGAELAPRDVVARAIWRRIGQGRRVFLDARACLGERFPARFPAITQACLAVGVDPARQPIPVRPAQHYHMGGIAVDETGQSSISGLYACGEAASTGLHGANRLASNSLSEAAVFARAVAESIASRVTPTSPPAPVRLDAPSCGEAGPGDLALIRPILSAGCGVLRDGCGLREAIAALAPLALRHDAIAAPATTALLIAVAAWEREESRGGHARRDFPHPAAASRRSRLALNDAIARARDLAPLAMAKRA